LSGRKDLYSVESQVRRLQAATVPGRAAGTAGTARLTIDGPMTIRLGSMFVLGWRVLFAALTLTAP
jgi:hypothetical protein